MVSAGDAQMATPRLMKHPAASRIGKAPTVKATVKKPVRLVSSSLIPSGIYVVKIKRAGGKYELLGTVQANADGVLELPVFRVTRKGKYVIAMTDATGAALYIKVNAA